MKRSQRLVFALALAGLALVSLSVWAIEQPELSGAKRLLFKSAELEVSELNYPASMISDSAERERATALGVATELTHFDLRTGRFVTLMPAMPLLPGSGVGNGLTWKSLGLKEPSNGQELQKKAWDAFVGWLSANQETLRIDPSELAEVGRVTVINPDYLQIYSPRRVNGIAVYGSHVSATIKFGNLISFSAFQWGDVDTVVTARLSREQAIAALERHALPTALGSKWKSAELVWVPVTNVQALAPDEMGNGLSHRLAWLIRSDFGEAESRYESLVDAVDGEVLAIQDALHYAASEAIAGTPTTRVVEGGVYPVSNDGINPDGIEQPDTPMLFSTVTTPSGNVTTDFGGNLPACVDGSISAGLTGQFMNMTDTCGVANISGTGDLDWSVSGGTDCTTPGVGGAGNTHASRSGFYEINMIKAMARSHLPNNAWLKEQLTANMNIAQTCNANWNGAAVNFYQSGGGCFNTGELAGVFDHEWGHGMDNNDGVPSVSSPGEGIADIYASLRLDDSCIGRNFRASNCGGYGNACTMCSGVRDIDWAKHVANTPFTLAMADACGGTGGPCGGSVHCEGQVYSQAVWDLWNRDLPAAPFSYSLDVAREHATQLTYRGAGGVTSWFSCTNGTGACGNPAGCGCVATTGYQQYLIADDDNGNLADGTPHMQAIFNAFNRHSIACTSPTVTTAGCAGTPTVVPVVSTSPRDRGVELSWTPSTSASGYRVYRTDGVFACAFGKELVATVTGTSYLDLGLKNGRTYNYIVVPMGANDECFSVASSCTNGTPALGANLGLSPAQATLVMQTGDGDVFLDNCESAQITIPVSNIGNGTQTNVRMTGLTSPSHPLTTLLTPLPVVISANMSACDTANAVFSFSSGDLDPGETLVLEISVTSDELAGEPRKALFSFAALEGDFQATPTKTFNFDTTTEGWTTIQGTFQRDNVGGGASATPFYMESSAFLDNQCDVVRSPVVRLTGTSTLSLFNNFDIEPFSAQWWDRANVGIRPVGSATRTLVTPNTGRPYNASGIGGVCGTDGQGGWAATNNTWASSAWDATALQSGAFAGQVVQLEVRFGTDASVNAFGFRFDQVTLTNFDLGIPDAFANTCSAGLIFADGFESGNTAAWSVDFP